MQACVCAASCDLSRCQSHHCSTASPQELSTELRATELKAADLESQLASSQHTVQQQADDMAELRRVVAALDAERDSLQAELDSRAEHAAQLRDELQVAHKQFSDLQRCVTAVNPQGMEPRANVVDSPTVMHPSACIAVA